MRGALTTKHQLPVDWQKHFKWSTVITEIVCKKKEFEESGLRFNDIIALTAILISSFLSEKNFIDTSDNKATAM